MKFREQTAVQIAFQVYRVSSIYETMVFTDLRAMQSTIKQSFLYISISHTGLLHLKE